MAMDPQSMMQDSHMMEHKEADASAIMAPKSSLGDVKVGDTVELTVKAIEGDMIHLEPASSDNEMSEEDMGKMTEKDAMDMPMDKLENRLPKAKREY